MDILSATPPDQSAIEALLDRCFGPARHRRTANLVRAGAPAILGACLVAHDRGALVGAVRCHQVALGSRPLAWLGPLVSDPDRRGEGIGRALMDAALAALGDRPVALIGDAPFYARWGFSAAATAGWVLPGPVDRARLLLRSAEPQALAVAARLGPLVTLPRAA